MKPVRKPARSPLPSESLERMLSRYYGQLVEWGRILARGDESVAEEIVQDLCLHLTVAQPDLSRVLDLDNYLFMCLRNMYVSSLARVSRERLRVIQVEDYDSVGMVAAEQGLNTVEMQNELIRICEYVTSRKNLAKSASHLILHFFLGYRRSDIALLARVPIAAIYNGLKDCRIELREHLATSGTIHAVTCGAAPRMDLLKTAIPSDIFLKRLRSLVLDADPAGCSAEETLFDAYKRSDSSPVECRELAHLAGCERCLSVLERILQLDDRDGPLDGLGVDHVDGPDRKEKKGFDATMRMVQRRREQLLQRRPSLLAIAVDGRVVAFHVVESAHNVLSSRVTDESSVQFIEVFDEFGDRLAHVPLNMESAVRPREALSQEVLLSDDRQLRLDVRFDGLGIRADVEYVDPTLAPMSEAEALPESYRAQESLWTRLLRLGQLGFSSQRRLVFVTILVAAALGSSVYRYMHPGWRDVATRAQAVAPAPLQAETLHQTLQLEGTIGPEKVLGSVDVWTSSDRRVVRRLFSAEQKLLATSVESADGTSSVRLESDATVTQSDRAILTSGVWRSNVSISAFEDHQGSSTEASRNLSGFEIRQREDGRDGILARTLVLDRNYQVQAERVRFRAEGGVYEVRLVQTLLRRVPNRSVPAGTFPEPVDMTLPGASSGPLLRPQEANNAAENAQAANREVEVLFALFQQNLDTGQPIDVSPIGGGRIRLTGTVAGEPLLTSIREEIAALPDADKIDFQIYSVETATSVARHSKTLRQELVGTASDAPALGLVRNALLTQGLKGPALKSAEQEFAASALSHAQNALQHAYALDRLGNILRRSDRSSLTFEAQIEWTQMVERHSTDAMTQLRVLRMQLDSISAGFEGTPTLDPDGIRDATAFAQATSALRARAQAVNEEVVELFAGSAAGTPAAQARDSVARLRDSLPLSQAARLRLFAERLANPNRLGPGDVGETHPR